MSDNGAEVERIMTSRPPSSYGSMCSEDLDDDSDDDLVAIEDSRPVIAVALPTRIRIHRPDSPETGITSVTQDRQTSIHNEGVFITGRRGQDPEDTLMDAEDYDSSVQVESQRSVPGEASPPEPPVPPTQTAAHAEDELSLPYVFNGLLQCLRSLNATELLCFVRMLSSQCKDHLEFRQLEQEGEIDVLDVVDRMMEKWDKEEALHNAVRTLYDVKKPTAEDLENKCRRALVQFELRANNKRRYYSLYEGTCRPGQQRYIKHVYVQSTIVLETPSGEGPAISTDELFRPSEGEGRVRVVVTTGAPATGLSVTMQMFITAWSEEPAHRDFQFVFALPGRDLHLVRNSAQTFLEFLASFYPDAKHAEFLTSENCSALFCIDALELCRQPLDFQNNPSVTEVTAQASPDALLTSLIRGHLLPHACVWITSHRPAARKIPAGCVSRFTRMKGFGDAQKDEYFTKRTKDPALGRRVLEEVKASAVLYDACYLPLFSWIVSFAYERRLQSRGFNEQPPGLATFFVQYVIVLTNRKIERYVGTGLDASRWKDRDKEYLMKMGKLALTLLLDGRDVFVRERESDWDEDEVAYRGGISYKTGDESHSFGFVHHSVQKFMAALYVYVTFRTTGENVLDRPKAKAKTGRPVNELYKPAIDIVLARRDGQLDLFLHFLLGLAGRGTEIHLRGHLLPQYHPEPMGIDETLKHARKRIAEYAVPDRCRNLELCLEELQHGWNVR